MSKLLRLGGALGVTAVMLAAGCAKSGGPAAVPVTNGGGIPTATATSIPPASRSTPPAAPPSSTAATLPTVAPTPATSPALWSTQVAGRNYLSMISAANSNLKKMDNAIDANSLSGLRKACKKQVTIEDQLMRDLSQGLWPTKIQPYIDKVIDNAAARRTLWRSCSTVASIQEWNDLPDMPDPNPGAAQRVRVMLGLPGTS